MFKCYRCFRDFHSKSLTFYRLSTQQKMQISVASMQASVWAAARMLVLHTGTAPIWRLRQFLHQTKSAPGGVQGRAALRAGAKGCSDRTGCSPPPLSRKSEICDSCPRRRRGIKRKKYREPPEIRRFPVLFNGTPEGTRTPNPRNRNPMLYPLSHRCVLFKASLL